MEGQVLHQRRAQAAALYMPALVAMRFNPDLEARHQQLREAGKPAKIARVARVRKLTEIANAPVKADRLRAEKPACA